MISISAILVINIIQPVFMVPMNSEATIVFLVCYTYHIYICLYEESLIVGDFPGGPVVKNPPSNAGTQVQSLVRELRSHRLQGD